MVEKLREKANVNYADAKDALERANWDLLDAIIILERDGKTAKTVESETPNSTSYSTKSENAGESNADDSGKNKHHDGVSFSELLGRFFRWVGKVIHHGNENNFHVEKHGESILTIPVTVLVLLLIIGFCVVIPLLIVGLFFGFKYSFSGPNLGRKEINKAMDKAAGVVDNLKDEINKGHQDKSDDKDQEKSQENSQ